MPANTNTMASIKENGRMMLLNWRKGVDWGNEPARFSRTEGCRAVGGLGKTWRFRWDGKHQSEWGGMLYQGQREPPWTGAEMLKPSGEQKLRRGRRGQIQKQNLEAITQPWLGASCILTSLSDLLHCCTPALRTLLSSPARAVSVPTPPPPPPGSSLPLIHLQGSMLNLPKAQRPLCQFSLHSPSVVSQDRFFIPWTWKLYSDTQVLLFAVPVFWLSFMFLKTCMEFHYFTLLFFPFGIIMLSVDTEGIFIHSFLK